VDGVIHTASVCRSHITAPPPFTTRLGTHWWQ
jgi:hypothetical protein